MRATTFGAAEARERFSQGSPARLKGGEPKQQKQQIRVLGVGGIPVQNRNLAVAPAPGYSQRRDVERFSLLLSLFASLCLRTTFSRVFLLSCCSRLSSALSFCQCSRCFSCSVLFRAFFCPWAPFASLSLSAFLACAFFSLGFSLTSPSESTTSPYLLRLRQCLKL